MRCFITLQADPAIVNGIGELLPLVLQGGAHLWATSDSAPRSEAVGTPQAAGVM